MKSLDNSILSVIRELPRLVFDVNDGLKIKEDQQQD